MKFFKKSTIFIPALFILLTVVFTFPLVLNLNSLIPGFYSTDEPYAALWYFGWIKYAHLNHLDVSKVDVIDAPFGCIIEPGYAYWSLINKVTAIATNPVLAYNLQVLSTFLLSGIITYLLAAYLFKNTAIAIFSAIIFAFCPYHFARSWQHLGLAYIQWMPLYILSLLSLREHKTILSAVFTGLSFALVMSFDLYYAYFMFIATILFIFYELAYYREFGESIKTVKLLFVSVAIILLFEAGDIIKIVGFMSNLAGSSAAKGVYGCIRPFEDLFVQSARPLSYFLPSFAHPVFGSFTEQLIGSPLYGTSYTEHTLYLGWVPIILAFIGFKNWIKENKMPAMRPPIGSRANGAANNFSIGFFFFLTVTAWLFSQSPWWNIFGFKLYMPSFFMYKIAPMFRAYCRFGIVVMLGVAILAGFGLKYLSEKYKSAKTRIIIITIACVMVIFEFWSWPPFKVIDVSKVPEVYYWLKSQPGDFTIIEYPLYTNGANELYRFYQIAHKKKIANAMTPNTYANEVAKTITKLSQPLTAQKLKWMGVKYVFVHEDGYLKTGLINDEEEFGKIPQNKNLKLIGVFSDQACPEGTVCMQKTGPIEVYEIGAQVEAVKPEIK